MLSSHFRRRSALSSLIPSKLLTAVLLATSLAACSDKKTDAPAAADGSQAAVVAAGTVEQRELDYWKPVSPHLTGSYGGNCTSKPEGKPDASGIVIAPDGKFTAQGYTDSLVKSAQTSLTHRRTETGVSTLVVEGIGGDFMVKLSSGDDGQGNTAVFRKGQSSLTCEQSKETIGLTGKNLYDVYAKELDTAPRKIHCVKVGELKMSDLDYQASKGVVKLQDDTFDLAKMDENVLLMNGSSVLSYTASGDGYNINLVLDKTGKLISVQGKGKGGQVYSCPVDA